MTGPPRLPCLIKLCLFGLCFTSKIALGGYTPFLPQSFFFDYDPPNTAVRIPVTEQCKTINITWGRGVATGPSPVAPYFLQVFTSTFIVPFTIPAGSGLSFQWSVPFAPGTLYQICMFDLNGNTGGCQATYTMIPPQNVTTPTTCPNVTFPAGAMNVDGKVRDGPLSQYGWIDQCTDIAVTPKNGTPPYTFTIAPTLHPPFRIVSNSTGTMNWTVSLSWASQFFISVTDSVGNSWANGPLHSGEGTTSACLAVDSGSPPKKPFPVVTLAGSLGAGLGGLLLGGLLTYLFLRYRARHDDPEYTRASFMGSPRQETYERAVSGSSYDYQAVPSISGRILDGPMLNNDVGPQYHIEPFTMPSENGRTTANPRISTDIPTSPVPRSESGSLAGSSSQPPQSTIQHPNQVYVVHHDSGGAPVTLYTSGETEIVELPPGYPGPARRHTRGSSSLGGDEDPTELPYRRRQPAATPRKGGTSSGTYAS